MLIKRLRGWEIPESKVTPEDVFLNRRTFLKAAGFGATGIAASGVLTGSAMAEEIKTADLYPATASDLYTAEHAITNGRRITPEKVNLTYNNFYEFGSHKRIYKAAQDLVIRPWTVTIDGMVENPRTWDVDDLIRTAGVEERIYRHRCVEAWSMIAPWTGFTLARLLEIAGPQSGAKFVRFETFNDPKMASGQRQDWYPWPYVEGLTLDEATNDLPFLVTGAYGKPLPKQMGAPMRLALPWKYGYKGPKAIVGIEFTSKQPPTFWNDLQPREYSFLSNVNPKVPHPRWSQASERLIGQNDRRVPTQLFNGYAEWVGALYPEEPR